jgi:hypothetical protein
MFSFYAVIEKKCSVTNIRTSFEKDRKDRDPQKHKRLAQMHFSTQIFSSRKLNDRYTERILELQDPSKHKREFPSHWSGLAHKEAFSTQIFFSEQKIGRDSLQFMAEGVQREMSDTHLPLLHLIL